MTERDTPQAPGSPYKTLILGNGQMREEIKVVSLPEELRDGGVTDLRHFTPIGWQWNGEMHYFKGICPNCERPIAGHDGDDRKLCHDALSGFDRAFDTPPGE